LRPFLLSILQKRILLVKIFYSFIFPLDFGLLHLYPSFATAVLLSQVVVLLAQLYRFFKKLFMILLTKDWGLVLPWH
jgi:hypothetical protein